jgi:hypothetical protein
LTAVSASLGDLPGGLSDTSGCLPDALAEPPDRLTEPANRLVEVSDCLAHALADISDGLSGAFAKLADGLAGPLADLAHRLARTLPDVLNGAFGAFADVLDRLASVAERLAGASPDLLDRSTQTLNQLGIAVERRQHPVYDRRHVIEPDLDQRLRLDALDVQLHLPEPGADADSELQDLSNLGDDRHVRAQVIHLEVNLVDLDSRYVDQHVDAVGDVTRSTIE